MTKAATVTVPLDTLVRWQTTLERGVVHFDYSHTYGSVFVSRTRGSVYATSSDGIMRRAVANH